MILTSKQQIFATSFLCQLGSISYPLSMFFKPVLLFKAFLVFQALYEIAIICNASKLCYIFFLNSFQWKRSSLQFSSSSTRSEKKAFFPQFHLNEWHICHLINWHLGKEVLLWKTDYLEGELEICFVGDVALESLGVFAVLPVPPCGHRLYALQSRRHFIVCISSF